MRSEEEMFTPETVDEQVEQLSRSLYAIPSRQGHTADAQLVQNLRRLYELEREDARSVVRVQRHLEQQGWLASERSRPPPPRGRRPPAPELQAAVYRHRPPRRQRGWMFRLATIAAVLLVTTLVGGLVVGLVLVHQGSGSKPVPTVTPLPPAPPSIYGLSNHAVVALNLADGKVRWHYPFTLGSAGFPYVLEAEDVLYFQLGNDLTVLSKYDGSVLWQQHDIAGVQAIKGLAVVESQIAPSQQKGPVYTAYDSTTGKRLWTFHPPKGNGYANINIALTDDAVYALSGDNPVTADNQPHYFLYALDRASGKERWSFQTPFGFGNVTAVGDTVYITGGAAPPVGLIALNASNGKERWHANNPDDNSTELQAPVVVNGVVYIPRNGYVQSGGGPATLVALQASDGKELWNSIPAQANIAYSEPTVANGAVYVTDQKYVYAFNSTNGSLLWQKLLGKVNYETPVVRGNVLYLPWQEDVRIDQAHFGLVALDAGNGHELWRSTLPPPTVQLDPSQVNTSGPRDGELVGGVIFTHTPAYDLIALDAATGQQLWQSSSFNPLTS